MGGRTGQRRDSSRAADAEGVSFGRDPERGVVLCGLGQEDQVAEGKAKVTESEDGWTPGSADASWWRFSVAFVLSRQLRGSSDCRSTPGVGRGEGGVVWPNGGS